MVEDFQKMKKELTKLKKKAKTKKGLFKGKVLSKPTAKLPSTDPKKFIRGGGDRLVREGRTGFFNEEMMEETKWLS
jgi:hypothetical protein